MERLLFELRPGLPLCSSPRGASTVAVASSHPGRRAQRLRRQRYFHQVCVHLRHLWINVLNASRHRWYFHKYLCSSAFIRGLMCSTPRAITGTSTNDDRAEALARLMCSTPRGITGTSTAPKQLQPFDSFSGSGSRTAVD